MGQVLDWRVYKDGSLLHLQGANPGTPYTACGLDAGLMTLKIHPPSHAGIWCTACMQAASGMTPATDDLRSSPAPDSPAVPFNGKEPE